MPIAKTIWIACRQAVAEAPEAGGDAEEGDREEVEDRSMKTVPKVRLSEAVLLIFRR